jgi:hypothetical protein
MPSHLSVYLVRGDHSLALRRVEAGEEGKERRWARSSDNLRISIPPLVKVNPGEEQERRCSDQGD